VSTKPIILIHTLLVHTVGIGRLQAIWRKLKYQLLPSRLALGFSERLVVGLNPGDRLLLFTDGITKASGPNGEEFGEKKLTALAKANCGSAASELNSRVLAQVSSGRLPPWPCLLPPWDRK
jgi:hypothetical protein